MAAWAVSDLHGEYELFLSILDKISSEDTVYFLGDACDRGPDGYDLMKSIYEQPNWIYLKGNHEIIFEEAVTDYLNKGDWDYETYAFALRNGGKPTLEAWEMDSEVNRKIWRNRIHRLPMSAEYINPNGQRFLLSHAGFHPIRNRHTKEVNIYEDEYRLCWDRNHMYNYRWPSGMDDIFIVHGHTPMQLYGEGRSPEQGPLFYSKRHKIDIDCATYNTKTAIVFNLDTFDYFIVKGENNG